MRGLIQRKSWVMDGNYGRTMDMRLDAADAVVFLGLPRSLYVRCALARRLRYAGRSRPDILRKLRSLSSDKAVFVPRSPTEVDQLVSGLEENPKAMQNR